MVNHHADNLDPASADALRMAIADADSATKFAWRELSDAGAEKFVITDIAHALASAAAANKVASTLRKMVRAAQKAVNVEVAPSGVGGVSVPATGASAFGEALKRPPLNKSESLADETVVRKVRRCTLPHGGVWPGVVVVGAVGVDV